MNRTKFTSRFAILAISALAFAGAQAQFTENFAGFMASLQGASYTEDFATVPQGQIVGPWSAPGANGFGFDAFAVQDLWGLPGVLSTNVNTDAIEITSTGTPITAFGVWIAPTDISGAVIPGDVSLTIDGNTHTVTGVSAYTFIGWTGPTPTTIAAASSDGTWVAIDDAVLGNAVPEPATFIALGLGIAGLALARRRK